MRLQYVYSLILRDYCRIPCLRSGIVRTKAIKQQYRGNYQNDNCFLYLLDAILENAVSISTKIDNPTKPHRSIRLPEGVLPINRGSRADNFHKQV